MNNFYNQIDKLFESISLSKKRNKIRTKFGEEFEFFNFIFLCGGNKKSYSSRSKIKRMLGDNYPILLAEKYVDCKGKLDLLSLERIFEAISSSVLICVESPGTFCELGAFTQLTDAESNVSKEIILFSNDGKLKDSFIYKGPISIIENIDQNRVIYAKFKIGEKGKRSGFYFGKKTLSKEHFELLTNKCHLHSFIDTKKVENSIVINDLTTFLAVLLDLTCFIGFINSKIAINYFRKAYRVEKIYLNCNGFSMNSSKVSAVCEAFFKIMCEMKVFKVNNCYDDLIYFVNSDRLNIMVQRKWYGSLIFNKSFLNSKKYLALKSDFMRTLKFL